MFTFNSTVIAGRLSARNEGLQAKAVVGLHIRNEDPVPAEVNNDNSLPWVALAVRVHQDVEKAPRFDRFDRTVHPIRPGRPAIGEAEVRGVAREQVEPGHRQNRREARASGERIEAMAATSPRAARTHAPRGETRAR